MKRLDKFEKSLDDVYTGYYTNQTRGALHMCWVGDCIAINKGEFDKQIMYAKRIRKLQMELGLEITDFKILH
jgi:hypothetical protein